jgi:uncharacterized protein
MTTRENRLEADEHERLAMFLASSERPAGTLSYNELRGFLFAITSAPQLVLPSEWLPLVFNDGDARYRDREEAESILNALMRLYNEVNEEVSEQRPTPPLDEASAADPLWHFDAETPLSLWARGFTFGHEWLSGIWDALLPESYDEELGGAMMVLSFFSSRDVAEAFFQEFGGQADSLEVMARDMLALFPEAMAEYGAIGRAVSDLGDEEPEGNAPSAPPDPEETSCPCGSGREYQHCCGARVTLH